MDDSSRVVAARRNHQPENALLLFTTLARHSFTYNPQTSTILVYSVAYPFHVLPVVAKVKPGWKPSITSNRYCPRYRT